MMEHQRNIDPWLADRPTVVYGRLYFTTFRAKTVKILTKKVQDQRQKSKAITVKTRQQGKLLNPALRQTPIKAKNKIFLLRFCLPIIETVFELFLAIFCLPFLYKKCASHAVVFVIICEFIIKNKKIKEGQ